MNEHNTEVQQILLEPDDGFPNKHLVFKSKTERDQGRVNFNYSRQSLCVKQDDFDLDDEDFGPLFIKVGI